MEYDQLESRKMLPCPFCGGAGFVCAETNTYWVVGCESCNAQVVEKGGVSNAIQAWNRRAQPAAEQDERKVSITAPERIWLVIGGGCPDDADFSALSEVTWCEDNIDGNGIEYVRASQAQGGE